MRRVLALTLAAASVAACAASPTQTVAPPSASPSATPKAPSSPAAPPPTSAPTDPPTPSPTSAAPAGTSEPAPTEPLTIRWHADDPVGILPQRDGSLEVARSDAGYVLIAELDYIDADKEVRPLGAFWSPDGREWVLARQFPNDERVGALTTTGRGFVATGRGDGGASMWLSSDGRDWEQVRDASLGDGSIQRLVATESGIVGFGWYWDTDTSGIWTSVDGREWLAATNESGRTVATGLQAVSAYDGRAIAIVDQHDPNGLSVWETTGRAEWTRTGTLRGAVGVEQIAGGPLGWVAIGGNQAWASRDGRKWSKALPGPDVASDLVADASGFVAVGWIGSLPGETCGDNRPFAGHTWTSADGRVWQQMPVTKGFRSAMVTNLIVDGRTLVGYGFRTRVTDAGALPVGRWTAKLPDTSASASASDPTTTFEGCGG